MQYHLPFWFLEQIFAKNHWIVAINTQIFRHTVIRHCLPSVFSPAHCVLTSVLQGTSPPAPFRQYTTLSTQFLQFDSASTFFELETQSSLLRLWFRITVILFAVRLIVCPSTNIKVKQTRGSLKLNISQNACRHGSVSSFEASILHISLSRTV